MEPQLDQSVVISFDNTGPGGMKINNKIKVTAFPPVGLLIEYVGGPPAGSKMMQYNTPQGIKTSVTIAGGVQSQAIAENQLRPMVMQNLERMFNEDQENLRKFQ